MPTPAARERGSASTVILGQLLAGAATAREIRVASGLSTSTTKDALRRLVAAGSVTASPDHVPTYRLATAAVA
jgi:DNA-binding IclR family transcriptional regulator